MGKGTEWVYAVQYRPDGAVKIGKSTDEYTVVQRVNTVRQGLPTCSVDVLFVYEAKRGTEKALHQITVERGKIVSREGREHLVGAPPRKKVTAGDLREGMVAILERTAESNDGWVGLYATSLLLGNMTSEEVRNAIKDELRLN